MKIQYLRKQHVITQAELAIKSGLSQQQIAKIENGLGDPRLSTLKKIAKAFNCKVQDLFFNPTEFTKILNRITADFEKPIRLSDLRNLCEKTYCISKTDENWENVKL